MWWTSTDAMSARSPTTTLLRRLSPNNTSMVMFRDFAALAAEQTDAEIDLHRRRSTHAHVWDMEEFGALLQFAQRELGVSWRILDTMPTGTAGSYRYEFGWLLARDG